jgi:transcriptional regulator with XRE-family HTH domain
MVEPLRARNSRLADRGAFADYLRALRGEQSQREVAFRAGKAMSWYRIIENGGRTYLTTAEVKLLAQALGADVREVFSEAQKAGY